MKHYRLSKSLKFGVSILLLTSFVCGLFANESPSLDELYASQKASIFLLTQSILLDLSDQNEKQLFEKIEKGMGKTILGKYIPISSGTAFLVSSEGHAITAAHCLTTIPENDKFESAWYAFINLLSKHMAPGYISQSELRKASDIFRKYAKTAQAVTILSTIDGSNYPAEILHTNNSDDLALIKITPDREFPFIKITEAKQLKEGQQVYSVGFPLQLSIDEFLHDLQPTITNGIISSLRKDKWDIQHSAAINFGNSGGPLFKQDGTLAGVNVGMLSATATSYYYAVNTEKLIAWLHKVEMSSLLEEEKK